MTEGPEPFEDEVRGRQVVAAPVLAPIGGENVFIGDANDGNVATTLELEIGELTADGILVDDEGPAPENAVPQPPAQGQVGEWEKQLICICRNNTAITDTVGKWKEKSWKQIFFGCASLKITLRLSSSWLQMRTYLVSL